MAESPHVEEARTSAHLACKLILKHGIKIGAITTQQTRSPRDVDWSGAGVDWDDIFRQTQARRQREAAERRAGVPDPGTRVIKTRFNSTCCNCGVRIPVESYCYWHLNKRRVSCYPACGFEA